MPEETFQVDKNDEDAYKEAGQQDPEDRESREPPEVPSPSSSDESNGDDE